MGAKNAYNLHYFSFCHLIFLNQADGLEKMNKWFRYFSSKEHMKNVVSSWNNFLCDYYMVLYGIT